MKIAEYSNEELFKELSLLEPAYYYGSVGTPEQTRIYSSDLFHRINLTLAKYKIYFTAETYHKKRTEDRIELWRTNWKKGPRGTRIKSDDWITIYKNKTLSSKSSQEDKLPLNNTKEDYNPWE